MDVWIKMLNGCGDNRHGNSRHRINLSRFNSSLSSFIVDDHWYFIFRSQMLRKTCTHNPSQDSLNICRRCYQSNVVERWILNSDSSNDWFSSLIMIMTWARKHFPTCRSSTDQANSLSESIKMNPLGMFLLKLNGGKIIRKLICNALWALDSALLTSWSLVY